MTGDEMLDFVKNNFPNLKIDKVKVNTQGWDNSILILNNEIVFRFPKSDELCKKIIDGGKILEILKSEEPILQVPHYEYLHKDSALLGVYYSFLEGTPLIEIPKQNLKENPLNAKGIGDFLTKLHKIDISKLSDTNLTTIHTLKYWESLYLNVKREVFPFLKQQQRKEIDEVFNNFISSFPKLTYKKTVIHGDLTTSNIIYNEDKGSVYGIIDFTDAQIGDPAFDFAGLYWDFGLDFTKDVFHWYKGNESSESLLKRVRTFYGLQPVFHELLYAIKNNLPINWNGVLKKFSALYQLSK
ncbi:aminoglycoside phosphotransferase family protein [Bacillaceae bacterium S4-13-56]